MERTAEIIARDVFSGLAILPSLGLGIACIIHLNKGKDPVRSGFRWLSSASLCLFVSSTLSLISSLIIDSLNVHPRAYLHISAFAILASYMFSILLFIVTVKLGAGHLQLWDHTPRLQKGAVYGSYALGFILGALACTAFVASQVLVPISWEELPLRQSFGMLQNSIDVILFVASAGVLGFNGYVYKVGKRTGHVGKTPLLLLVASTLIFVAATFSFAAVCFFFSVPRSPMTSDEVDAVIRIYEILLMIVALFHYSANIAAIAVLYVAGRRNIGGLWSSEEEREVQGDFESEAGKQHGERQGQGGAN